MILFFVIPAKAGTQREQEDLGSRFRGNDQFLGWVRP